MPHLLLELGCEELPARQLNQLEAQFAQAIEHTLTGAHFSIQSSTSFATPRRLAVLVQLAQAEQLAVDFVQVGPAIDIAYDDAQQPTKACIGFAKSNGVEVTDLEVVKRNGKKHLAVKHHLAGEHLFALLPELFCQSVSKMHLSARMRWHSVSTHQEEQSAELQFVRPIRWVTCLLDDQPMPAGTYAWHLPFVAHSYGHRVHHPQPVVLKCANQYKEALHKACVMVKTNERKRYIVDAIGALANQHALTAHTPDDLLDEVSALVEWPQVIMAQFHEDYLTLPAAAITTTLTNHQRYFHAFDATGALSSQFFIIANQANADNTIRVGNERVVTPRLDDAKFFVESDMAVGLAAFAEQLHSMGNVKNLGTLADKHARLALIAHWCIERINAQVDTKDIQRAALLCKADLLSGLVGEFPELQGVAGAFYATDETQAVRQAIGSHYKPINTEDDIPADTIGWALSLAERADVLVGLFAVGVLPAGDKDPFALRRTMNGLIKLLEQTPIALDALFGYAHRCYQEQQIQLKHQKYINYKEALLRFCFDRLPHIFPQYAHLLPAVCTAGAQSVQDILCRSKDLVDFTQSTDYQSIMAAYKRVHNMLKNIPAEHELDESLFAEEAERQFCAAVNQHFALYQNSTDYQAMLRSLAELTDATNQLLDTVTIHSQDAAQTNNRKALLAHGYAAYSQVANLALLPQ